MRQARRFALISLAACVVVATVPAASFAATLRYQEGVGLRYRAAPGEVNHLAMNPFAGPIEGVSTNSMTIQDDSAPLVQLGTFCLPETPLRCPSVAMYAYMGDGSDYGVASPYFRDAYIWGQGGNDDVTAERPRPRGRVRRPPATTGSAPERTSMRRHGARPATT